jgi:tetratricopeptide (TPR) repeat protein
VPNGRCCGRRSNCDDDGFLAQNALLRFCPLRRLGAARPAPAPDKHRLGLVFMAAAPRGQVELDYEAEETAILNAVSTRQIDLVVEESGEPVELGARLRELDTMQAVHLSCHGLNSWRPADQPKAEPKPILAMEDREGNEKPTDAVELWRELRPTPRLAFLSACLSAAAADRSRAPGFIGDKQTGTDQGAAGGQLAHSLATALIEAGLPAVLGCSLRETDHAGVLLYGQGRRGKSSLAARIVSRCQDRMVPAVLFGHYDARSLVDVLENALMTLPAARDLVRQRKAEVRDEPARFQDLLVDLLCGPCRQLEEGKKPLLLIIDDLERILEPDPAGGRHKVRHPYADVLAMVLRAFDPAATDSRLIVTSRYPFSLGGLEARLLEIPLPPLSEAAQRKLELRQTSVALEADRAAPELTARLKLLPQVRGVARGNPGLQDLIGQKLVLSTEVPRARAEAALRQMEDWLGGGDPPEEAEVRTFLEDLTIDTLLDLAGASGREVLSAMVTFDLPVPVAVVEVVANELGGAPLRLCDVFEDLVDHRDPALAVNALAAPRPPLPPEALRVTVAKLALPGLFAKWGGRARPTIVDHELTRLGLMAGDAAVVGASAAGALRTLEGRPAEERAQLGQAAIALLEADGQEVPWRLLGDTAAAVTTVGEGEAADALFAKGVTALEAKLQAGEGVDAFEAGYLLFEHGKRLAQRGELDDAEALFARVAELAQESGREVNVAIARGEITDILVSRGELEEALRIRTEEQLPVYERLGEVRSIAITKGKIADILMLQGDLDDALAMHLGRLPVAREMKDIDAVAHTLFSCAQIRLNRGDHEKGEIQTIFEELSEAYDINLKLQRPDGIGATGMLLGQVLAAGGHPDEAVKVLTIAAAAFDKIGQAASAAQYRQLIEQLKGGAS